MKTVKKYWLALAGLLGVGCVFVGVVLNATALTVPAPMISITVTNTNQVSITVTNGVPYANYILYNQHVLGDSTWTFVTNPVPGVSNFVVNMGPYFYDFYLVSGSTNWNNNGIPNWEYADPNNPGLGVLTVSIVSPSQGQILQ
ncbi:MAG TPA: hypothetical protein VGR14_04165 [Verrucomicrobiae bacterium]|jgi:hypothetical protein|nr:hypothetical protein [Verrucomicrobiae bacterium]